MTARFMTGQRCRRSSTPGTAIVDCHERFGIAHATWIKAIKRGEIVRRLTGKPYADADGSASTGQRSKRTTTRAHSYRECMSAFRLRAAILDEGRRARRAVDPRLRRVWTAEEALAHSKSRHTIKRHLLEAGILENRCDWCGLSEWRGRPISIQIDHINGIRDDHRLENLRMLCPNCHSQTETFAARNRRKSNGQSRVV